MLEIYSCKAFLFSCKTFLSEHLSNENKGLMYGTILFNFFRFLRFTKVKCCNVSWWQSRHITFIKRIVLYCGMERKKFKPFYIWQNRFDMIRIRKSLLKGCENKKLLKRSATKFFNEWNIHITHMVI